MNKKWRFIKRLYLCKCGACFEKREHFTEHLKDSKRYRKHHYAMDYNEVGFTIWEYTKRRVRK